MKSNRYYFIDPEIEVENKTLKVNDEFYPIKNTESIYLVGNYNINEPLINMLNKEKVILHFADYYGNYIGSFYPYQKKFNTKLVDMQYKHYYKNQKNQKLEKKLLKSI